MSEEINLEEQAEQEAEELREEEIALLIKWKIDYTFPEPFTQRDLQKYQTRLKKLGATGDNVTISVFKGAIVLVAIELGWTTGLTKKDVGDLLPGQVTLFSNLINLDVLKASSIPNE